MTTVFMPLRMTSALGKPLDYCRLMLSTVVLIRRERPAIVWVQLPQLPALWAVLLAKRLFCRDIKVVADCHNALFRPPWSQVPFSAQSLRACDLVLVHNDSLTDTAKKFVNSSVKVMVLEDAPAPVQNILLPEPAAPSRPLILFPGSFSEDEPVTEVLAAARLAPDMEFVITGRTERAHGRFDLSSLPTNVLLPGFLPLADFEHLLRTCTVVLALTRFDGIQLSVCNEAIGFGKPMVVSDTSLLRRLFGEAAVLVDSSDPASIAAACRHAVARQIELAQASTALAAKRTQEWLTEQASPALAYLSSIELSP